MTTTSDSDKCSISRYFIMSCRGRADAFARRLHARLSSLGAQNNRQPDETTWLASNENTVAVTQPRPSDPDLFLDIDIIDPGSPEEENPDHNFITNAMDNLTLTKCNDGHDNIDNKTDVVNLSNSSSDSNVPYYDLDVSQKEYSDSSLSSLEYSSCVGDELSRTLTDDSFHSIDENKENENKNKRIDAKDEDSNRRILEGLRNESAQVYMDFNELKILEENVKNLKFKEENDDLCIKEDILKLKVEENSFLDDKKESCNNCDGDCDNITLENEELNVNQIETDFKLFLNNEECEENGIDHLDLPQRVRRCSSLKTGKTPPDTPGRKKIVRFADVLGLDLADVRTFLDEIPKIPNSAYDDLPDANLTSNYLECKCEKPDRILLPLFVQPGGQNEFLERIRENQVCLENALVEDGAFLAVRGTVRVRNLDFNKSVHIRYTLDGWKCFSDLQCSYVNNSCDGFSDKFTFLLYANTLKIGERLEFAVRFQCKGTQFWDSNRGKNYCFQCLPTTSSSMYTPITAEEPWSSNFYYNNDDDVSPEAEDRHRHLAVQEYIAATLERHRRFERPELVSRKNPNLFAIFAVVVMSIVFLYVQRAVYFT